MKILEGTWEEIKDHDIELTGCRVTVIVEPNGAEIEDLPTPPNSVRDLAQLREMLLEGVRSPKHDITDRTVDDLRAELRRRSASQQA